MSSQHGNAERADLVVRVNGASLAAACAARGWTYTELARRAGISRVTMTAAIRGHTLRPSTAWKLARALSQGEVPKMIPDLLVQE